MTNVAIQREMYFPGGRKEKRNRIKTGSAVYFCVWLYSFAKQKKNSGAEKKKEEREKAVTDYRSQNKMKKKYRLRRS
jgi:hypothetical protein